MLSDSVGLKEKPYVDDRGENIRGYGSFRNNQVGGRGTDEDNQSRDELGSLDKRKNHKLFKEQLGCVYMES